MNIVNILKNYVASFRRILQFESHDQSTPLGISDERYRRIILSGTSTLIVKIVTVAISLITVPLTIHYLGTERYGLWMSISSIMALMNFADLGLGNGLLNAISSADGKNDLTLAKTAVSSTFFILCSIAFALFIIFVLAYPFIKWERVFNVHDKVAINEAGPTIRVLILTFLVNIPLDIIQRVQEGHQEGFKYQKWLLVGSVISFISLLICIHFKGGLPILVGCYSAGSLVALSINGFFVFNGKYRELLPKWRNFDWSVGKQLINVGLVFFVLQIFILFSTSSDDIIIAQLLGAKSVAGFEIVKKMFLFSMLTQFIIQPLWPAFSEALASGDFDWVKKTFKKIMGISLISSGLIALPLLLFGKLIISLWVGNSLVPSWLLLCGFYTFIYLSNYNGVMSTFLNSNSTLLRKQTIMIGLSAISAILLKIVLVKPLSVSGVIWATIIGYSIFYVIPSYKLTRTFFKEQLDSKL